MSLFNTRELWSTHLNDEEGFSDQAMVIANVDNSPDDRKKIIIGSLSGLLRIFSVNSSESGYQANDLLLETELKYPILQLTTGQYLSASDNLNLAILHPRKLSVYSVSGTSGYSEHGSSYNILLIYEHNLQRSAYNMVSGPFGQVKGREFLCVQSIDGSLSFYEQESFAFSRFLPNFLIPGPIVYIPATDSFVVSTGCWSLESYRYQVLAISKDGENRDDATTGKGRRVTSDWSIILNEAVLDMQVIQVDKKSNCIVVLGERSLTVFKESGSNLFSKKLDYTPTCMTPYLNSECLMVAVCSEFNSILVYNSESLKWAAQLPFVPVAVHRDTVAAVQGCLVFLSDSGHLSCNYLGTVPELHLIHVNNSENAITNYAEAEAELQELKHIINAFNTDSSGLVAMLGSKNARVQQELDIIVSQFVDDSETDHGRSADIVHPVVNYDIRLVATANLTNVRAMLQVPWPLVTSKNVHVFSSVASDEPKQFQVKINLREPHLPANLKMNLVVAFTNKTGIPRTVSKGNPVADGLDCLKFFATSRDRT
ncbi:Protein PTHB1 [Halotydeus destructor]|nr:Protein PTHB1 [Halotydeus destructor]